LATAGFQVEGGFNGPGEPANNWSAWERSGRVEPSGIALDFWNEYEHHLDRAAATGCDAFRMSVEWARCEPAPGEIDAEALAHYAQILSACHERGLTPLLTLHHFTHPVWLGEDFWLSGDAPERFAGWASTAVAALSEHCASWVTINEINVYAMQTYFLGLFPPGRVFANGSVVRALDHLLAGHVLAYDAIRARQPHATIATNTYSFSAYETDRLLLDVLLARRNGVERRGIGAWLTERRRQFLHAEPPHGWREIAVRQLAAAAIPLEAALPRAIAAVYASPNECTLDMTQIDFYDPRVDRKFRVPGHTTAGGRNWLPARLLWDDPPDPAGLRRCCAGNEQPGLGVWVVENGLCNRVRRGVAYPRLDGWDRVRYLRSNIGAVVGALIDGVDVGAYFHWCLADNYEWGTYEPRFGLYGIDRERGVRWSELDSMGGRAAETYREIITGLRAGDLSVVDIP
jgi:beta-glucosidase/6-phospho-beta-glucosidase/beta-galactosidase